MFIRSAFVASILGIAAAGAGSQPLGAPLRPIKPWVLDYADAQCFAFRQYGSASEPISLAVRPAPSGETFELLISRTRAGPRLAEEEKGSVDFGKGEIQSWVLNYGLKSKDTGEDVSLHQFRVSAAEMAQGRAASQVTFKMKGAEDASFTLEAMPQLLDGLASCNRDLQDYWNMGGEKDGRIAVQPKGDVRKIFTFNDYPAEAMDRGQEGWSQFLLLVNEQGKVAGCHVERASGIPLFDVMGCQVIRERMKFAPALDVKGSAVRSTYITPPIRWQIDG